MDNSHVFTVGSQQIKVTLEVIGGGGGEQQQDGGAKMGKKEKKGKTRKSGKSGKVSGYMKFSQKIRPDILKQHPELKTDVIGVARKIGEKWRALSQEEKNSYN
jgi:hypothetical protein